MNNKVDYIAFYLPQYHPCKENDEWYGKGFTEWTNVAKAKPLFPGHYQPHIPSELGFYDLRLPEVRREQARMAQDAGISAFCYWNYWFGNGKQLLDMPIWEVYKDKTITLPFCLAWANHSWERKLWDGKSNNEMLMEQLYLGVEDYEKYFYTFLSIFKDERYYKLEGKLFFIIYNPLADDSISEFIMLWRKLAKKEGLPGFYFIGKDSDCRNKEKILSTGIDAIYDDNVLNIHHHLPIYKKVIKKIQRNYLHWPTIFEYKDAIKYMITENDCDDDVIPVIAPNWDHSPRSKNNAFLFKNCDPVLFYQLVKRSYECAAKKRKNRVVLIKAWNEWGEGNHMEPDLKHGRGYLDALIKAIGEMNNHLDDVLGDVNETKEQGE